MSKPPKVIPEKCEGYVLSDKISEYKSRDVLLYALGLGISNDSMDIKDLQFTYENSENFAPLPTFAAVLIQFNDIFDGLVNCPGMPEFNPMLLLHASHKVSIHSHLPTEAKTKTIAKIKNVFDKKNAAIISIECVTENLDNQKKLCTNELSLYIRGIGGFSSSSSSVSHLTSTSENVMKNKKQASPPDAIFTRVTNANQALIYRLSGDYNPLHADPNMAAMGGFEKPILHGLCFFGIATHSIIKELLNNDASLVSSVSVRFSSTVTPSDSLCIEAWKNKNQINFQVLNKNTRKFCITEGCLETTINLDELSSKL